MMIGGEEDKRMSDDDAVNVQSMTYTVPWSERRLPWLLTEAKLEKVMRERVRLTSLESSMKEANGNREWKENVKLEIALPPDTQISEGSDSDCDSDVYSIEITWFSTEGSKANPVITNELSTGVSFATISCEFTPGMTCNAPTLSVLHG